mgnify:CR=1 FL=1
METKSTVKEKAKAYLESLSEKQKRGILIAMLVFTCVASGIVLLLSLIHISEPTRPY